MVAVKAILFFSAVRFVHDLWHGTPLGETVCTSTFSPRLFGGNGHVVDEYCTGPSLTLRNLQFWSKAAQIYSSYKWFQLSETIGNQTTKSILSPLQQHMPWLSIEQQTREERLKKLHEVNSERMMNLCLELRGFYLKSGQFLGTRHDFMPMQYTSKLCRLHDDVPALDGNRVRQLIEHELQGPIEDYFHVLNLSIPIGSASIAQVHKGIWKGIHHRSIQSKVGLSSKDGQEVAVKVQNPDVERLMTSDLQNLRKLANFLTNRREVAFDLSSAVEELQQQITFEFDFRHEAENMQTIGHALAKRVSGVEVASPIFTTKRLMVMSFVKGENLSKLKTNQNLLDGGSLGTSNKWWKPRSWTESLGKKALMKKLAHMWAVQIFSLGAFHADPHPGNICFDRKTNRLGLFDWGQVKVLSSDLQQKFAELIVAIGRQDENTGRARIAQAFLNLGIQVQNATDISSIETLALTMFDTRRSPRWQSTPHLKDGTTNKFEMNPFSARSALKRNAVLSMPRDIFFLLRTIQIMRGYATVLGVQDFSLAHEWYPLANDLCAHQK